MNPVLSAFLVPSFGSVVMTTFMQTLILSGAILLVAGGVALWAVLFRKKPRNRGYRYQRPQPASPETKPAAKGARRRRRTEPPRNPTLAETRGLPPIRDAASNANEHYQH